MMRFRPSKSTPAAPVWERLEARLVFAAAAPVVAPPAASPPSHLTAAAGQPAVSSVSPTAGALNITLDTFVSAEVSLPNGGIDPATITSSTVFLVRMFDGERVPAAVNTSGGGDVIVLKPTSPLAAKTTYTFTVTAGLKDVSGVSFAPFTSNFKTGIGTTQIDPTFEGVRFTQVALPTTQSAARYLGTTIGPDHQLYAGGDDGAIYRWPILADGTLGPATKITTLQAADGPRYITGIVFDPASTAADPILWITHSAPGITGAPDWTGSVSRLSGPDLGTIKDIVVHLPRSARDHLTQQLSFGPDGDLYFCQASNSSLGAPDAAWENREEHLLNATILRLDVVAVAGATAPIDALTTEGGGSYDPFAAGAPLTIYAEGIRNAYDLVWHTNGQLYAPANGSAAGGNAPAGEGAPALTDVRESETDYLFRIDQGGYYGHPNPRQGHFVVNGGNPTASADPYEVPEYPVGTQPDPAWKPAILDMGAHESPDGAIEYMGGAFNGVLNGKLLVTRFSGGDDIVVVTLSADGKTATGSQSAIPGLSGFVDPVDLVEDKSSGNLYVVEYDGEASFGKITLVRVPGSTTPTPTPTTPTPTPTTPTPTTPTPTPTTPPERTKKELKLIAQIGTYAAAHALSAPDTTTTPGDQLKGILSDLKWEARIVKYATAKGLPTPSFTGVTGDGFKALYADLQLAAKRQAFANKVTVLAQKKQYPLPDLSAMTLDELKGLFKTIQHYKPTA